MVKLIASFLDICGLIDLHKNKSRISHFSKSSKSPIPSEELKSFYPVPAIPEITFEQNDTRDNYNIGKYKYKSEISGNGDTNIYSTGSYYKNNKSKNNTSVILVHGWRMDSFDRINKIYLKAFMDKGYNIYSFTLPHHFERTSSDSLYNGELMVSTNIDRTLLSVKQAITDLRALIRYLKEKNSKVILVGISLGGFITNLAAVVEEGIDALISVMYANNIAFSVWKSDPGKYIKKDFISNGYTYEDLQKLWAITIPSNFKPIIPKEHVLLVSGMYDKYVLAEDTDYLWEEWGKPKRVIFPCGHSGIVFCKDKIRKVSLAFLGKMLD